MMQHVPEVLVSNAGLYTGTDVNAAPVNSIVVKAIKKDGTTAILADATGVDATVVSLQIGLVSGKGTAVSEDGTQTTVSEIQWANPIQRKSVSSAVYTANVPTVEDSVEINFGSLTPEVGYRYVLRIQRTDIHEHPGTMTYSYEYVAKTAALTDLIAAFVKQINRDARPGVVATSTATTLTITAQAKTYHDYEKYSQVNIEVFMHQTIPSGLLTNVAYAIPGVVIEKTPGTPGKGNAFIVNDRENAALGYRGITYRENVVYPFIAPKLNADLTASYNEFVVEYDNLYLSNDNQYIKTTPLSVEIYSNTTATAGASEVNAIVTAFAAL